MHGTVVVLANTTPTTTTPARTPTATTPARTPTATTRATATAAATASPSTTDAQSTAYTLPMTGFAVPGTVLAGFLLTGLGLLLRKKIRA